MIWMMTHWCHTLVQHLTLGCAVTAAELCVSSLEIFAVSAACRPKKYGAKLWYRRFSFLKGKFIEVLWVAQQSAVWAHLLFASYFCLVASVSHFITLQIRSRLALTFEIKMKAKKALWYFLILLGLWGGPVEDSTCRKQHSFDGNRKMSKNRPVKQVEDVKV